MVPNFVGVPMISKVSKTIASGLSGTTTVQTNLTYDQMYRVTAIDQYHNNSATVSHVAAYQYNELGEVIMKHLRGELSYSGLFRYICQSATSI